MSREINQLESESRVSRCRSAAPRPHAPVERAVAWDVALGSEPSMPLPAFVEALERCIAELSATVSRTSTIWADHCESPGDKTQFQVPWHVKKAWHV